MNSPFLLVQYNTQELDQRKFDDPQLTQVKAIHHVLKKIESYHQKEIDFLSLQEISLKDPKLIAEIQQALHLKDYQYFFHPALTGVHAKKKPNGNYHNDPQSKEARKASDPLNFGIFPHQYSSGLFYRKREGLILNEVEVIENLRWKDFNPNINLADYRNHQGGEVSKDIELFDKGLIIYHFSLTQEGKEEKLQLVQLHTTPAFHFGQEKTMNYQRNHDQLRFLAWMLTGKSGPHPPPALKDLVKFERTRPYIAFGDWNVDVREWDHPLKKGAQVIGQLTDQLLADHQQQCYTLIGSNEEKIQLDYILPAGMKNWQQQTFNPDHPCFEQQSVKKLHQASDHFPVSLLFSIP